MHVAAKIAGCAAGGVVFGAGMSTYAVLKVNEGVAEPKPLPAAFGVTVGAIAGVGAGAGAAALARDAGVAMSKAGPAGVAVGLATGAASAATLIYGSEKIANAFR